MGSDGTVGANKEAVKIIAAQEGMHAQVCLGWCFGACSCLFLPLLLAHFNHVGLSPIDDKYVFSTRFFT